MAGSMVFIGASESVDFKLEVYYDVDSDYVYFKRLHRTDGPLEGDVEVIAFGWCTLDFLTDDRKLMSSIGTPLGEVMVRGMKELCLLYAPLQLDEPIEARVKSVAKAVANARRHVGNPRVMDLAREGFAEKNRELMEEAGIPGFGPFSGTGRQRDDGLDDLRRQLSALLGAQVEVREVRQDSGESLADFLDKMLRGAASAAAREPAKETPSQPAQSDEDEEGPETRARSPRRRPSQ